MAQVVGVARSADLNTARPPCKPGPLRKEVTDHAASSERQRQGCRFGWRPRGGLAPLPRRQGGGLEVMREDKGFESGAGGCGGARREPGTAEPPCKPAPPSHGILCG